MSRSIKRLTPIVATLFISTIVLFTTNLDAATTAKSSSEGSIAKPKSNSPSVSPQAKSEKKIDGDENKSPWGFGLGYSVSTDFAEEARPRQFSHSFSGSMSYALGNGWSTGASLSMSYQSIGNKVVTDIDTPSFSPNVRIGGGKTWKLGYGLGAKHSINVGVGTSLSFSESAQYEGVYTVPGGSVGLTSKFFDGVYSLSNRVGGSYVINRYEFSPTDGTINTRNNYSYRMSHRVKLIGKLSASVGFGIRSSEKLDGSSSYGYSNSQSLSYSLGKWGLGVSHRNGGYTQFGDVDFWYIDKYRRLMSASVSYSF